MTIVFSGENRSYSHWFGDSEGIEGLDGETRQASILFKVFRVHYIDEWSSNISVRTNEVSAPLPPFQVPNDKAAWDRTKGRAL